MLILLLPSKENIMLISLTPTQLDELKKLLLVVTEAINQGATTGEASSDGSSAEWTATEIKITLA